jgi:protein phosphatase
MTIELPNLCLVVLIGPSGAGKSTFARRHFLLTEVVSSDYCRGIVSDDENSLEASDDAFDLVHYIIEKRLKRGRLTVVDATNVQESARKPLVKLARKYHVFPVAIVLNLPEQLCHERNVDRPDRNFGPHVVRNQRRALRRSIRRLRKEGFRFVYEMKSPEETEAVEIIRRPAWNDRKELTGPFDIIGDVHGCFRELRALLRQLGYRVTKHRDRSRNYGYTVKPPAGRRAIFVGDLVDRGPASNEVLRLVMSMVEAGTALCVCGNHDSKLLKKLDGRKVQIKHGLAGTLAQLAGEPPEFIGQARAFLRGLISHYVLDEGKLVVAHAGLREEMQGRTSKAVRAFCLYGETTGEIDEFGLPVRYPWAQEYKGRATVVYGHTPIPEPEWLNRTVNIDTGCVFGGKLTALRYPERELISVEATKTYCEPARPIAPAPKDGMTAQQEYDDLLHIEDVLGKRVVHTEHGRRITIRQENATAALEVMSRFAVNPKWLVYLPPTMSPTETSQEPGFLEHPAEAFQYYRERGIAKVVCEEKHMGSRAIVVISRDEQSLLRRFGIAGEGIGRIYTRTGRAFFDDRSEEQALLVRLNDAMDKTGFWEEQETDWALLDCELMPWSAKAQALLQNQYAAVGAAAQLSLPQVKEALEQARRRGIKVNGREAALEDQLDRSRRFVEAYRQYCWTVDGIDDYKLAPFHLMATEGQVHTGKEHVWHMKALHRICDADPEVLLATTYKKVDLSDEQNAATVIRWWEELTESGGEGMVVKPWSFVAKDSRGLIQPAVKCRGREYLRIIYGPDYTHPDNLKRLRKRGLGRKRSLARREFALGVEALQRFVRREPLRRIHECVFGILALESEPVDPAL